MNRTDFDGKQNAAEKGGGCGCGAKNPRRTLNKLRSALKEGKKYAKKMPRKARKALTRALGKATKAIGAR